MIWYQLKTILNRKYNNFLRTFSTTKNMANSRFDYVRSFEIDDTLLPNTWMVVRIDGKAFHKFSKVHDYEKPNDEMGLLIFRNYITLKY